MTIEKPNTDQSTDGSLPGKFRASLENWLRGEVDDMLPAEVISYDDATNRAVIKPLVMIGTTSGGKVPRSAVSDVPVFRFGGGGFFIRFPIKSGDKGWLKASDRDMSLIKQSGWSEEWPNTKRLHDFSDAMFFPDQLKDWVIDGANSDSLVIQSVNGNEVIAVRDGEIEAKVGASSVKVSAAGVDINAPYLRHNGVNVGSDHKHPINSGSSAPGPTGDPQ